MSIRENQSVNRSEASWTEFATIVLEIMTVGRDIARGLCVAVLHVIGHALLVPMFLFAVAFACVVGIIDALISAFAVVAGDRGEQS